MFPSCSARAFAHSLAGLDRSVREMIVMAADLPDEVMSGLRLDYSFSTGDSVLDATAPSIRKLRVRADSLASGELPAKAWVDHSRGTSCFISPGRTRPPGVGLCLRVARSLGRASPDQDS